MLFLEIFINQKTFFDMKKILFCFLAVVVFSATYSQNNYWTHIDDSKIVSSEKLERGSKVVKYKVFQLDFNGLKTKLLSAPHRESKIESDVIVYFPNANGNLQKFKVYEAPVMHKNLNEKHQSIRSYVGVGLDDKTAMIRFSTTIFGFHGMIFSGKTGDTYIDPYTTDLNNYIVYFKSNTISDASFECLTESVEAELPSGTFFGPPPSINETVLDGSLRKYRLALAGNSQYCAYHINAAGVGSGTLEQKKAAVLAAMNVTMTRVNGVYERDLSITMELVSTNENIIYVDDSTLSNDIDLLWNQIQGAINTAIGTFNYDIGHVFSTSSGGGVAALASVCSVNKARGITGSSNPVGDPYDIDYVAHEMGHQFGANHTQNNNCNRNNATAVETGSGSTIMGYAGICAPNVQNNSDAYFHAVSLAEIKSFILNWGACSDNIDNGNTKPTISFISNYTIPKGTAFVLKGNGADADGDDLTYCWEQTNQQVSTQPPVNTSTTGPNFRSLSPSESPNRYMPVLSSVLQGNLAPTWEVVPNVGRTMSFALTVRDNNINGGEFARVNATVATSNTIGPFVVTSQNTAVNWESNSEQTITWNVAGTTGSPVNTSNVNILLSDNGGASFDYVLATNTPNDGSETITVPNIGTANARIMVEAVGNIFYAVNSTAFSIGDCNIYTNSTSAAIPDGVGANQPGTALVSTLNVSDDIILDNIKATVNINHTYIQDLVIILEHPNGTQVTLWDRNCGGQDAINVTFEQGAAAISCANPTAGTYSPVGDLSVFDGLSSVGEWKLNITDHYNTDTGTLVSWSLDLGCVANNSDTDNFSLSDFRLYPNPNNGIFTLEFDSVSSEDIHISVFDIRGRKVFNQTYSNTGKFSQNINLNNVQSGVYLMNVKDGKTSETRKIVIE